MLTDEKVVNNAFSINSLFRIAADGEVSMNKASDMLLTMFRPQKRYLIFSHKYLQAKKSPRVESVVYRGRVAIAIEDGLTLFEDESFKVCKYLPFESNIDCLTISSSGDLVICALTNGAIYGVHIKGVAVFTL